jgi:hypothetical protein
LHELSIATEIISIIGNFLPSSSNFFLNYVREGVGVWGWEGGGGMQ